MNSDYELNINLLILKYVNGSISEDEANLLAEWVKSSTQNARYFRSMCRSFENQLPATAEAEAFWTRMKDAGKGGSLGLFCYAGHAEFTDIEMKTR